MILLLLATTLSWAVQMGEVLHNAIPVFQYANPTSPKIGALEKGQKLPISNQMMKGNGNVYWYKVRLPNGDLGYVLADAIQAQHQRTDLKVSGIDLAAPDRTTSPDETVIEDHSWNFVVRGMGLGAYQSSLASLGWGGEGEVSLCPGMFFDQRAYERHKYGLGIGYGLGQDLSYLVLSGIYRIYDRDETREPEFRLRVGQDLKQTAWIAGASAGMRHPLGLGETSQIAFYWEAGFLFSMTQGKRNFFGLGSVGLGFHF